MAVISKSQRPINNGMVICVNMPFVKVVSFICGYDSIIVNIIQGLYIVKSRNIEMHAIY